MRIGVIGNGAVGLMTAYRLSQNPSVQIDLFGKEARKNSGSRAAGAMLVAFSEIEADQLDNPALKLRFELAKNSLKAWPGLLDRIELDSKIELHRQQGIKIVKSARTTPYEKEQLDYMKKVEEIFPDEIDQGRDYIKLTSEMSIDARQYLNAISTCLKQCKNVKFIHENPKFMFTGLNRNSCSLSWNDGSTREVYDHIVIAAGSGTRDILSSDQELFEGIPNIFYGIGTALLIEDVKKNSFVDQHGQSVVRTMNRGGACGYHLVNCGSYYYFGATNAIHHKPETVPRVESLHTLTDYLKKEFSEDFGLQLANFIVGYRPTTADTLPLLGAIENNRIIFATGNKRDGLTCSPEVAREVEAIIMNGNTSYDVFTPRRQLISYFDRDRAILKTAKSNMSGNFFHDRIKLEEWDKEVNQEIESITRVYDELNIPPDFGIHPEMFNMFKHKRIIY